MSIGIEVLRNVDGYEWNNQFRLLNPPDFDVIGYHNKNDNKDRKWEVNDLEIGAAFILANEEGLWYASWTVARNGGQAWDIRKIVNVEKFLSSDYYYWEFVKDSWSHGHYYRLETYLGYRSNVKITDKEYCKWYKIPTDKIPRGFLPSVSGVCNEALGKYSSDLTEEDDNYLIEYIITNKNNCRAKWKLEILEDKATQRNLKLRELT